MRIIVTGFKPRYTRAWPRWDAENWTVMTASHGLLCALPELGHDVRYVVPDPRRYRLDGTDCVLIFVDNTRHDSAAYALPALIMAHECRQRRIPYAFVVSDAGLAGVAAGIKQFGQYLTASENVSERQMYAEIRQQEIGATAQRWGWAPALTAYVQQWTLWAALESRCLIDGDWPPVLGYAFPWGQREALQRQGIPVSHTIDPTRLVPNVEYQRLPGGERRRAWVWASMRTDPAQQWWCQGCQSGLAWNIDRFGRGRMRHEREVVQATAESWGRLMHVYPHAAGAWWRHGIVTAMRTGAIVCCHPDEVSALGGPFLVSPEEAEALSEHELRNLARQQEMLFRIRTWSKKKVLRAIDQFLTDIRRK